MRLYFNKKSGYYYREVDAVAKTALNYFSALAKTTPPSPDQVVAMQPAFKIALACP